MEHFKTLNSRSTTNSIAFQKIFLSFLQKYICKELHCVAQWVEFQKKVCYLTEKYVFFDVDWRKRNDFFSPCFSSLCAASIHFLSFDNTFTHYCTNFAQEFEIFYHLRDKYTDLLFGQSQTTLKFKMAIFLYFRWFLKWTRDLKLFDFFFCIWMSYFLIIIIMYYLSHN